VTPAPALPEVRSDLAWFFDIDGTLAEIVERPELGGDARVVGDVVAEVGERARVDRAQPDRIHAQ